MPTERQRLVAKLVIAEGRTIVSVAKELGIGAPGVRESLIKYCIKVMPELEPHLARTFDWDSGERPPRDKLGLIRSHRAKLIPRTRIYLAGPMSGIADFNYPAFHTEAARLRALGFHVENPAENPTPHCGTWVGYMRNALRQMLTCEAVALLDDWQRSRGALIEHGVAINLGIPARPASEYQGQQECVA